MSFCQEEYAQSLIDEIDDLIFSKQEGAYWDFKRQWHERKDDLLHDIICMANNLCNRDAYLIIGVDQEKNYTISGVESDPNRKSTQKLVDFLKDKKFAGGIRPIVFVEEIKSYQGTVDVIVVKNSHNTPFFLTESFQRVKENSIYTRIMDTNTPIDKSADIDKVEQLWKKRFYLDEIPLEKMSFYLKSPQDWEESPADEYESYYYKQFPEFVIKDKYDETRNGYEFYIFGHADVSPHWSIITLYYHQTMLRQFQGVLLDGGRWTVVAPDRDGYSLSQKPGWDVDYVYYIQDSTKFLLQGFMNEKQNPGYRYIYDQYLRCVLVFTSRAEKREFDIYFLDNQAEYHKFFDESKSLPFFPDITGKNMDYFKKEYRNALALKKMLSSFRGE